MKVKAAVQGSGGWPFGPGAVGRQRAAWNGRAGRSQPNRLMGSPGSVVAMFTDV